MIKKYLIALLAMLLLTVCACADGEIRDIPDEMLNLLAKKHAGFEIEDYAEIPDSPKGDLALALVRNEKERRLVICLEDADGMTEWLFTAKGIPQHENEGWIDVEEAGLTYTEPITWLDRVSDGLRFTVGIRDDNRETTDQSVTYQWQDGGFKLVQFSDQINWYCYIYDGYLQYLNWSSGDQKKIYGALEQDIRFVSYEKLPKTIKEAEKSVTVAPAVPKGKILGSGYLAAKEIKFTGGRNYAVYTGPGEQYLRSGNGKGTVSTNDWIQVFGQYEDYIMIQYDISADQFRIGWIEASALPKGTKVPTLELWLDHNDYGEVYERCVLTDDPFNSEAEVAVLEPGTAICELVHSMGGWSYIRVTIDGKTMCGFVPMDCISHG